MSHNNQLVLRLVQIGFLLQFYIPAVVCVYLICAYFVPILPVGDLFAYDLGELGVLNRLDFATIAAFTLAVLAVQCVIFTLGQRLAEPCPATGFLLCLIVINIWHGRAWMVAGIPLTAIRLTPPTILYIIAVLVEWIAFFTKPKEVQS